MKKLFLLVFIISASIIACNKSVSHEDVPTNDSLVSFRSASDNLGIKLPDNAIIEIFDGYATFTLPSDYRLIGISSDDQERVSGGGKLTCDCLSADGNCTATETDKTVGCNTEKSKPCSECKGTVSSLVGTTEYTLKEFYIQKVSDETTSFMVFSSTRASLDLNEWNAMSWYSSGDLELENEIKEILAFAWDGFAFNVKTIDVLMVSEAGKFFMEIPFESIEAGNIYTNLNTTEGTTKTTCSGCSGNCVLKKAAFGKVRYCDGCDSGCTISW